MAKHDKNKVIIVGCGPGLKAYIHPKAIYNIKKADILVGSKRLLKLFPRVGAEKIVIEKNYTVLVNRIADWRGTKQVVVLVSGDPCFFSYTKMIVKKVGRQACAIIPGISSVQLAFAAIGESWDDACFISLHGRDIEYAQLIKKVRLFDKVGILTDQQNTPSVIARRLLDGGIRKRSVFVCENLSLPDERILEVSLATAVNIKATGAATVIIIKKL